MRPSFLSKELAGFYALQGFQKYFECCEGWAWGLSLPFGLSES